MVCCDRLLYPTAEFLDMEQEDQDENENAPRNKIVTESMTILSRPVRGWAL
jgi:hypothetical protein